jgi:hypothetical protein
MAGAIIRYWQLTSEMHTEISKLCNKDVDIGAAAVRRTSSNIWSVNYSANTTALSRHSAMVA